MGKQKDEDLFKKLLKEENRILKTYESFLGKVTGGNTRKEIREFIDHHKKQAECINNILLTKGIEVKASPFENINNINITGRIKKINEEKSREAIASLYREEIKGALLSEKYCEEVSIELKPEMENLLKEKKSIISNIEKIIEEK